MSAADASTGPAWYERAAPAPPGAHQTIPAVGPVACGDDDVAAIIRRAAQIGIPAWRVTTALGLPTLL
ncbi:hypothetical protein BH20ACT17_BH20ACT17_19290 [soil metagenome]|jgi:hypothetical protein